MNFNKGECVMEKIAVLIPCYNEEKTIKKVVEDWKKELRFNLLPIGVIMHQNCIVCLWKQTPKVFGKVREDVTASTGFFS